MGIIFSDLPFTELSEYARIDCLICRKSWINNSIGAQIIGYRKGNLRPKHNITADYTDFSTIYEEKLLLTLVTYLFIT